MRLLNVYSLELEEFWDEGSIPQYAAISHRWSQEEVTFQAFKRGKPQTPTPSWDKLLSVCRIAKDQEYKYIWMDTVCIDKSSSAELSEAINSMYRWYSNAAVCCVYLSDVPVLRSNQICSDESFERQFMGSKWFTRGWTLQELLAPQYVKFYGRSWDFLGDKRSLTRPICKATGVSEAVLGWQIPLADVDIPTRISWVERRETSRVEDLAYSLLGIFDINMPLLYGEGIKALYRLQEEILKIAWPQEMAALASNMMRNLRTGISDKLVTGSFKESRVSRIWSTFTCLVSTYKPSIWSKPSLLGWADLCNQRSQQSLHSLNFQSTPTPIRKSKHCSTQASKTSNDSCVVLNKTLESVSNGIAASSNSPEYDTRSIWPVATSRPSVGFAASTHGESECITESDTQAHVFDPSFILGSDMSDSNARLDDISSLLDHTGTSFPTDPFGLTHTPMAWGDENAYSSGGESSILPACAPSIDFPTVDARFKRAIPMTSQRRTKKMRMYGPRCDSCDRTFTRTRDRERHLADIHGQTSKSYKCCECGYYSKRKDKVMSHCRHKHGQYQEAYRIISYHTGHSNTVDTPYVFSSACTPWNESSPSTGTEQPSSRSSPAIDPFEFDADGFFNLDDAVFDLHC